MSGPPGSEPALSLEGVRAGYGGKPVLEGLSLRWGRGEFGTLIGPNGSGKSTLLRVATGWLPAQAGAVRLFGSEASALPAAERAARVALVPQELSAAWPFTVEDVVLMGRTATLGRWARPGAAERRAAEEAMDRMDVLGLRRRNFNELSGGERQRAAIAMALAREPGLLLLDEPTSHLDLHHAHEILGRLERLHRERAVTVLMTSHDLGLAGEFSRRLLLLDSGRIVADGPPEAVLREDRLEPVYRSRIRVRRDPSDGSWVVRPVRPGAAPPGGPP